MYFYLKVGHFEKKPPVSESLMVKLENKVLSSWIDWVTAEKIHVEQKSEIEILKKGQIYLVAPLKW